ncbi:hypothetical protein CEXT_429581 [Caerostris extrusa]|uniref:Uncharacterized protein n=1 Tax=Caerostris extrusa TaxID=172846 RepID=A0AAV4PBL9_CAEEX|nr:hypothetical protein CEXT_429581 [Caerostris extrusa]
MDIDSASPTDINDDFLHVNYIAILEILLTSTTLNILAEKKLPFSIKNTKKESQCWNCKSNRLFEEILWRTPFGGIVFGNGKKQQSQKKNALRQRPISTKFVPICGWNHPSLCSECPASLSTTTTSLTKLANSTCSFKGELCPRSSDCNAASHPTAGIPPFSMQNTSLTAQTQPVSGPMDCGHHW